MNKKRLIVNSVISIVLVSLLFIGNTYSVFTSGDVEEDINVYTTGNLDITYTLSSDTISLNSKTPVNEKNSYFIKPYRITINNNGTVPYQFNLTLTDTTASDVVDYQYVMARVGKLDSIRLSSVRDNIIYDGVIVDAGKSIDIDVRVWLSDDVVNSEMGKSFYAKLSIDGIAIYSNNGGYDNSNLVYPYSDSVFSDYIEKLYNKGNATEFSLDNDANVKVNLDNNSGIMLDNNNIYRYYGDNPNNYVSFNNEVWRIVSLDNVYYDDKDLSSIRRVKLVRDNSIGNYKLNRDLINGLDKLYYESLAGKINDVDVDFTKGINKDSRELIDTSLYFMGSVSSGKSYEVYESERNCKENNVVSKVGLIYLSDYLYVNGIDNKISNWLYRDNGIGTISINGDKMYSIDKDYNIVANDMNIDIYPTVYLRPDVIVTGGNGSLDNPYKISNSLDV